MTGRGEGKPRATGCPTCGKTPEQKWRPFCSRRCADVDLGRWFGERYVLPGEPALHEDEDEVGERP